MAGGNENIGVMSRNLYLGADLGPVIAATDVSTFLQAATAAWLMVQKNDFDVRAEALAGEIAARRPGLVGLQEAFMWRTQTPADGTATPAETVRYDYVAQLILVGDLNSHPGTEGEAVFAGAHFSDAWPAGDHGNGGLTCCWAEDLSVAKSSVNRFSERIDYVLTRGRLKTGTPFVTGSTPASRVGGLFPSDHGGVFVEVRIGDARSER